jgi:hypothetical protein
LLSWQLVDPRLSLYPYHCGLATRSTFFFKFDLFIDNFSHAIMGSAERPSFPEVFSHFSLLSELRLWLLGIVLSDFLSSLGVFLKEDVPFRDIWERDFRV